MGHRRLEQQVSDSSDRAFEESLVAKRRRIAASISCGVFLGVTWSLSACGRSTIPPSPPQTNIVVGVPEGKTADAELGIPQFLRLLSFESLTNNGADGRPIARLADRWQWENENTRLRVVLRPNVLLHDGRVFTGDTAVELVRSAITNRSNVAAFPALADVVDVSAEGDELLFDLSRASATLPEALTVPLDKGNRPVGTGPYRLVEEHESDATLEAFDRYYQGTPTITRISVKAFDSLRPSWASLMRGELDMVYDVPADAVEFIRNDEIGRASCRERVCQYV